jgi:hypothetical protein
VNPMTILRLASACWFAGIVAATAGCYGEVSADYPYGYGPDYYPSAAYIATTPPIYFEGRPSYYYGNRWYYRDGGRWNYYRSEPRGLSVRRYQGGGRAAPRRYEHRR